MSSNSQNSADQGSSVADILAKMKQEGEWDGDILNESTSEAQADSTSEPTQAAEPAPVQTESDENADVNQYMNQLLDRYTGDSDGTNPTTGSKPVSAGTETAQAAAESAIVAAAAPGLLKESEYRPSHQAPEKTKNLDALRQLANHSTRSAVSTYMGKAFKLTKSVRVGLFGFAFVATMVFFFSAKSWGDPKIYASMFSALITMFAGGMAFILRHEAPEWESDSEENFDAIKTKENQ